ncbi:hypothetical protein [Butyrivibrio sp. NC2007]|uniref:hypothetical protein n=1 Tax=Butyrivibrio sp. NC2007 TaxID=1280683 RepID=UPI0003B71C6D|nr:hypothetical protein [Butyrivibrio sp. NC2007]
MRYYSDTDLQRKIEDERAGRLDFVYETSLSIEEAIKRIGTTVHTKLSSYNFKQENGVMYIIITDDIAPSDGLHYLKPLKYAIRFESEGNTTIIRVRYIWDQGAGSDPYLFQPDVDEFFCTLFDAKISSLPKKIWIDGTDTYARNNPARLLGSKNYWIVLGLIAIIWLIMAIIGFMRIG